MHVRGSLDLLPPLLLLRVCLWPFLVSISLVPLLSQDPSHVLSIPFPYPLPQGEEGGDDPSPTDQTTAPEESGGADNDKEKTKPWWLYDLTNPTTNVNFPLGMAVAGAMTDVAFQALFTQKTQRLAREKKEREARMARAQAAKQRKRKAAAAAQASERRAFEAQESRIHQQAILDLYLQEQKETIREYVDRQLQWEAYRRWLQDPHVLESIYTPESFSRLLSHNNDTNGVLFALFMKTKPDSTLPSQTTTASNAVSLTNGPFHGSTAIPIHTLSPTLTKV